MEPGSSGRHGRVEKQRRTKRRADALRQDELIVLGADRGHKNAKDVEDSPNEEKMVRTISIIQFPHDWTLYMARC